MAHTLLHTITKIAEGLAVGAVIMVGHYNGAGDKKQVGISFGAGLWLTVLLGLMVTAGLFFGAHTIFRWYALPDDMIAWGVPYLRVRSFAVLGMFVSFGIIGFLRGVKNTRVPMQLFGIGALVFVIADYLLIFGGFGIPAYGFMGSAWASVIQYVTIVVLGCLYIWYSDYHKKYEISLFNPAILDRMWPILLTSVPVMMDKATLAIAKVWLCCMINPLGKVAMGSFHVIKDMEQFAFAPAVAFAQVITLLVSNDFGGKDWLAIKNNIKKILFMTSCCVLSILMLFSYFRVPIITMFDKKHAFTDFAAQVFPALSVLVFFDLLQLILAAALRGASNVQTVMMVRLCTLLFFFMPVSYLCAQLPIESMLIKFLLIYGSFYVGNGLMGCFYLHRFRGQRWKNISWR